MLKPRPKITTAEELLEYILGHVSLFVVPTKVPPPSMFWTAADSRAYQQRKRDAVREIKSFVARQSARKQRTGSGGAR